MKMRKGFTLIELLIVLAIIAALMAVVTPIALNAVRKAKASQVAENLRNIRTAVESYFYVNGELPEDLDELNSAGYLNEIPTGYGINEYAGSSGEYIVEVYYTGHDIDPLVVESVYADVEATVTGGTDNAASDTGDDIYVRFKVQSWQ